MIPIPCGVACPSSIRSAVLWIGCLPENELHRCPLTALASSRGTSRSSSIFARVVITVPPLRDRREDIPPLVHDFVRRAATRVKKDVENVSSEAMSALMNHRRAAAAALKISTVTLWRKMKQYGLVT